MVRADLEELVEPATRGDPMAPLLWTAKSLRTLAAGLGALGHRVCHNVVGDLLRDLGYSLQANCKTREGTNHPDRDAQFGYINDRVKQALAAGEPAISVDTKKKELVGDFKNGGREYRPKGQPEPVRVHDFVIRSSAGQRPTASTTSPAMPAGSVSASTTTPRASQSTPFAAGGRRWAMRATRRRRGC